MIDWQRIERKLALTLNNSNNPSDLAACVAAWPVVQERLAGEFRAQLLTSFRQYEEEERIVALMLRMAGH